jgi:hypothetical protein
VSEEADSAAADWVAAMGEVGSAVEVGGWEEVVAAEEAEKVVAGWEAVDLEGDLGVVARVRTNTMSLGSPWYRSRSQTHRRSCTLPGTHTRWLRRRRST